MKQKFKNTFGKWKSRFLDEELPISYRLGNLIMLCTAAGCGTALIFSMFINRDLMGSLVVLASFLVVSFCLYLSAWKNKPKLAMMLVILLINEVIFPIMFFVCGGIRSGMSHWLVVGLIFPYLVLEGSATIVVYVLGFFTFLGCFMLEYMGLVPFDYKPLQGFGWFEDVFQSMVLVSLVFGVIFKFQSSIYTKQANALKKREQDLKDSLEKLEHANKAKSDFLANMSHEIRTPINAIMGMNEIILRDSEDKEVIQNAMNIQSASNNLLSIVNDILDFSKIEAGMMDIIPVDYKLSSLLIDCYNLIEMRAYNKGLKFSVTNDPQIPECLHGDEFRIRQIVTNLLTNAVKYTKAGSIELMVSVEGKNDETVNVVFAVKDTGVGIAKEDQKLLFNSFQRIDEKSNRTIEGTGLGLTISARLAEQMGGCIYVESEKGKGSVFSARIPQKYSGTETIGNFKDRVDMSHNRKKDTCEEALFAPDLKVLAVDDVKTNLAVVKGLLKHTGIQLTLANGGRETLERCSQEKYDLIFLDHMMPEMDGIETFHHLREDEGLNKNTPVIVLTANAILGAEEQYIAEGFDDYISKPVHGKELEEAIRKFAPSEKIQR